MKNKWNEFEEVYKNNLPSFYLFFIFVYFFFLPYSLFISFTPIFLKFSKNQI